METEQIVSYCNAVNRSLDLPTPLHPQYVSFQTYKRMYSRVLKHYVKQASRVCKMRRRLSAGEQHVAEAGKMYEGDLQRMQCTAAHLPSQRLQTLPHNELCEWVVSEKLLDTMNMAFCQR